MVVDAEEAAADGALQLHENAAGEHRHGLVVRRRGRDRRRARGSGGGRRAEARQPALDPDADGGARRGGDLRAVDGPVHGLDDLAGPAHHAPADDGVRLRDPGEQDALHRAAGRRRLRDEDLPLPRVRADGGARGEARAPGQVDRDEDARTTGRRRTAATTSRTSRSARRRTARSPRSRRRRTRTSAASSRRSGRASRRRCTGGCCPARTGSRTSTARCSACTRTPAWSTRTAVPAGRRRPTSSSGRSTWSRTSSGSTRSRCGAGTSSRRTRSRTTPGSSTGLKYDTGDYEKALDRALEIVDYDGFRRSRRGAGGGSLPRDRLLDLRRDLRRGAVGVDRRRRRGLGRLHVGEREHPRAPDRQGRGHDRHAAAGAGPRDDVSQIVASELGIPIEDVTVEVGDTQGTPFGYGTYASRSAAVGAVAVYNSLQKIKAKARRHRGAHARGGRRRRRLRGRQGVRQGLAGQREDDPGDRGRRRRSRTTCPRARSRSSTTRPTTTRRTARSRSARTSRWSRSTPRPAR